MNEILVLAEHRQGAVRDVTLEMLARAGELARGGQLATSVVVLGAPDLAASLHGAADRILTVAGTDLVEYNADSYLPALEEILRTREPVLTMMGHTSVGMDLAPALAVRLGVPLATDCLEVELSPAGVGVLRTVYGGKLHERLTLKQAATTLVTVRAGSCAVAAHPDRKTETERLELSGGGRRRGRRFLEYLEASVEDVDIGEAPVLVSVGRGLGGEENLAAVKDFADAIGATLACSRPVVDQGWLPKSRQVGSSGRVVRPKVYLALGISGAYQHVIGMSQAETIIAVNRDPAAPIFDVAHYGIVGDMFEVMPLLKDKLARTPGSRRGRERPKPE